MALYFNGNKIIGSDGTCSADKVSLDDTNLSYEANDVQEAFEKVTKSLTYDEYEALTDAEKNNGTIYLITDVNGDGQNFQPVIYSTAEREIGVWTDGKPLYEKTFHWIPTDPIEPNTDTTLQLDSILINADVCNFLLVIGGYYGTNNYISTWVQFNFGIISDNTSLIPSSLKCVKEWSKSQIVVRTGGDYGNFPSASTDNRFRELYITAQYTKTTDTAGSGTWTPQGVPAVHYSTDEQIVGTWVDGKTLYEKTYSYSISSETSQEIATLDSNIVVKEIKGIIHNNSNDMTIPWIDASFFYNVYNSSTHKLTAIKKNTGDWTGQAVEITIRYTKSST